MLNLVADLLSNLTLTKSAFNSQSSGLETLKADNRLRTGLKSLSPTDVDAARLFKRWQHNGLYVLVRNSASRKSKYRIMIMETLPQTTVNVHDEHEECRASVFADTYPSHFENIPNRAFMVLILVGQRCDYQPARRRSRTVGSIKATRHSSAESAKIRS